jgi:DNA-binding transcriptional LysR family regulator
MPREPRFRQLLEQTMKAAGFEPRTVFEGTNAFGIATTVGMGFGVGVVPLGMETILGNVVIRSLDEPDLTRHVFALVRAGSERSPTVGTVLDVMDEGAEQAVARGVGSLPPASRASG